MPDKRIKYKIQSKMKPIILIFSILLWSGPAAGQLSPVEKGMNAINQEVLKSQVGFLASDWMEGRKAGERGELIASDYIASILRLYGVKPAGDYPVARGYQAIQINSERTYFQNFTVIKSRPGDEQVMTIINSTGSGTEAFQLSYNIDFAIRSGNHASEIMAPVIFVGYGFGGGKSIIDELSSIDLKGKMILRISGVPQFAGNGLSPSEITESVRQLEQAARAGGAVGLIEFNPASEVVGSMPLSDFKNMSPAESGSGSGRQYVNTVLASDQSTDSFIRISISANAGKKILNRTGVRLEDYIEKTGKNHRSDPVLLPGKSVFIKSTAIVEKVNVRNVIGIIEGNDPSQVIVLGAHYDHLGMTGGYIWNGADDNASGTAGVMTIAKAITESGKKPEKTIIVALWTAEEDGLLGSEYFVKNLPYPSGNVRLNVNFDMISRYIADDAKNRIIMTYNENQPLFRSVTEENIIKHNLLLEVDYQPSADPPGGSDHRSFVAAGIPVLRFKPGHRNEYHTPADEVKTLDWDIMEKIVKLSFANIWELSERKW